MDDGATKNEEEARMRIRMGTGVRGWFRVLAVLGVFLAGAGTVVGEQGPQQKGRAERVVPDAKVDREVDGIAVRGVQRVPADGLAVVVQEYGVPYSPGEPSNCMKEGCRFARFTADVARKIYNACVSSVPKGPNVPSAQHACGELLIALELAESALDRCYAYVEATACQDDEDTNSGCRQTFGWPGFC